MDKRLASTFFVLLLAAFFASCSQGVKLEPKYQDFTQRYGLLMNKTEEEYFKMLETAGERDDFIREFWESRDPNLTTPTLNEFKEEVDQRILYAERNDREMGRPGYRTERGRMMILLGPPDSVNRESVTNNPEMWGIEVWNYPIWDIALIFTDRTGNNVYRFVSATRVQDAGLIREKQESLQEMPMDPRIFQIIDKAKEGLLGEMRGMEEQKFPRPELTLSENKVVVKLRFSDISWVIKEGEGYRCDLLLKAFLRSGKAEAAKVTEVPVQWNVTADELRGEGRSVEIPLEIQPGNLFLTVVVVDKTSGAKARKIIVRKQ